MRVIKLVIVLLLIIVILALIAAVLVAQLPFTFTRAADPSQEFNNVLKKAYDSNPNFGDTPITKIALLGAHDSLSNDIEYSSASDPNEEGIASNKFYYYVARGAIARYSKAQKHDVLTQLNAGVRYIDARITCIDKEFYSSHGMVSAQLRKSLSQILEFLSKNSGEFIIFHIVHFYPGESSQQELDEFIKSVTYKGKCLYDFVNYDVENTASLSELTYNKLTDSGKKAGVLLVGSHKDKNDYSKYYKLNKVNSAWHNVADSEKVVELINENCKKVKDLKGDTLVINQAQTTPTKDDLIKTLIGWSLLDMAAKHNIALLENENFDKWLSAMPIFVCDFSTSTDGDFNAKINEKILNYNKKL